jgi:hypothetical protein
LDEVYIPFWESASCFSIISAAMGNLDAGYREQYDAFLKRLRQARRDAGMTQEEVARSNLELMERWESQLES